MASAFEPEENTLANSLPHFGEDTQSAHGVAKGEHVATHSLGSIRTGDSGRCALFRGPN
jgi:hypothetical protein